MERDEGATHTLLRVKLQAIGFGFFVPFFFISTGMSLEVGALVDHPSVLARVPVFLAVLLVVRAAPIALYRPFALRRAELAAVGLFQATSLSNPVVAGAIGVRLGLMSPANYAALVAAGLLSVLVFPALAVQLLRAPRPAATTHRTAHDAQG